ncbi:uncharacterized protein LOC144634557 [Oculina patagonica]
MKGKKVFFEDPHTPMSQPRITYDGVPFIITGKRVYDCHQGTDRHAADKQRRSEAKCNGDHSYGSHRKKEMYQTSKKFGCTAQVIMREVIRFPQHKITVDTPKRRKTASKKLRKALENKTAGEAERRVYIYLPRPTEHSQHVTGENAGFLQRMDPRLRAQIKELVDEGVRGVNEMRRHLRHYVTKIIFKEGPVPSKSNRRFFPSKVDIRNTIYECVVKNRYSKVDQENLEKKIQDWKQENPEDFFMYQPYAQVQTGFQQSCENGGDDEEDSEEEVVEVDSGKEGLLFVHQTKWQRRLLNRYGNELSLLDATYRTTKYALPLFFLVVKTNVDYQVVGSFVLQSEASTEIEKALKVISEWNPDWSPKSFLVDYSEAEIGAVERLFPDCKVFICDFHREQAWERWLSKGANGASPFKKEILCRFRRIARAATEKEYKKALADLQEWEVWKRPELQAARLWFHNTWIREHKRWVWAFKKDRLLCSVCTTNGVERQNKSFKYEYLEGNRNANLSTMLTILVDQFLPDKYTKYVEENTRRSKNYKRYDPKMPPYLYNRPRHIVQHCLDKRELANAIPAHHVVSKGDGKFEVHSQTPMLNVWYKVSFGGQDATPSCMCDDWQRTRLPCKHMFAIFKHKPDWGFESLSEKYRNSPFFTLDEDLIFPVDNIHVEQAEYPKEEPVIVGTSQERENNKENLPYPKRYNKTVATQCRDLMNQAKSLTFIVDDPDVLEQVRKSLQNCVKLMENSAPKAANGLILEQNQDQSTAPIPREAPKAQFKETSKTTHKRLPLATRKKKIFRKSWAGSSKI